METLTVKLNKFSEVPDFAVDVAEMEDTTEQRLLGSEEHKTQWTCTTPSLNTVDALALRTFYFARKGHFEAFQWVCPFDGVTYTVRFVEKSFKVDDYQSFRWVITFGLKRLV